MPPHKWTASESAKRFAREVADQLSRQILGNRAPWQRCWDHPSGADLPPFHAFSRRNYSGLNGLKLRSESIDKGYGDPRWLTRQYAETLGAQVRPGEKGTIVEYLSYTAPHDPEELAKISKLSNLQAHHHTYTVFNADQIDGLPDLDKSSPKPPNEMETCERAARMISSSGASIETHEHDYSTYDDKNDTIKMPASEHFRNPRDFYSHAILQLSTWTGNKDRAPRLCHFERKIDNQEWSRELMRTSIAAMHVSSELRLPYNSMAGADQQWSQSITHNPDELRMSSADADRISKYILDHDQPVHRHPSADSSPSEARSVDRTPEPSLSPQPASDSSPSKLDLAR